ncbi:MAG: hypothetical protein DRG30_04745 [Epsilonproteobacteria bacterium]|nr:MAG: hypothetical protein DRG30_04745 [Campylobacterota bacterium]
MKKKANTVFEKAQEKWKQGKNRKSFKLYKKCALMGNTICYEYLAYMYSDSKGVQKNLTKAMYWYRQAEEAGHYCHHAIAYMYDVGEGVKKDKDKAMYWYKKGVERDDSISMHNIAILYREQYKYKKMLKWFKKALKHNDGDASLEIAKIYLAKAKIQKAIKYLKIAVNHKSITPYDREKSQLYLDRIEKFCSTPRLVI